MTELQQQAQKAKEILAEAVAELMEKKRLLGQYAVIYKDGKPTRIIPGQSSEESDKQR